MSEVYAVRVVRPHPRLCGVVANPWRAGYWLCPIPEEDRWISDVADCKSIAHAAIFETRADAEGFARKLAGLDVDVAVVRFVETAGPHG